MTIFPENKDGNITSLEGVKVSDEFIVPGNGWGLVCNRLVICTKVTPKLAEIGGNKYRIDTAFPYGDRYRTPCLSNATPERKLEINLINQQSKACSFLSDVRWREQPRETVMQIYKILTGDKK